MGSYCELKINGKCILSSKSNVYPEVMSLFTANDKFYRYKNISDVFPEDYDCEDDTQYAVCEYVANVSTVKKRLDILGFSLIECKKSLSEYVKVELEHYSEYLEENKESDLLYDIYKNNKLALENSDLYSFIDAYKTIFENTDYLFSFHSLDDKYKDADGLLGYINDVKTNYAFGIPIGDLRFAIRILLECFDEHDSVVLDVSDLIAGGYYDSNDELVELARQELTENYHYDSKIIILTEGSSDKLILEKTFEILYPQFSPYYAFMDFGSSKSAGGASALVSVLKAFLGAGIKNRVIAIFDNDTAAKVAMKGLQTLQLPDNIRVMTYPIYNFLMDYPTIGPSGKHNLDVNNVAGSIELYLCKQALLISGELSPVQWKGYEQSLCCYQGEVLDKGRVQQQFFEIIEKIQKDQNLLNYYDWDGLRLIYESIFCVFETSKT